MLLQENNGNAMKVYIYKKDILARLIFQQIVANLITLRCEELFEKVLE